MGGLFQICEPHRDEPGTFAYEICGNDRIIAVETGEGKEPAAASPFLHRVLWDLLGNGNIADIYRALVHLTRTRRERVCFHFRCDEPDMRRVLVMSMEPTAGNGVRFSSRPLVVERQAPGDFLERHRRPPVDVEICEICGTVLVAGRWRRVDHALEALGVFAEDLDFRTWPARCPDCRGVGH